jgi:hypothetical protein
MTVDQDPEIGRLDYVAIWLCELRERRRTPTTFDNLWSAACYQKQAEEVERLANDATVTPASAGALRSAVYEAWQRAHRAYLRTAR